MFLHAVATGLRDDNIRHRLRPILKSGNDDVYILKCLNEIHLSENEHQAKIKSKSTVGAVSAEGTLVEKTLQLLQSEMSELKETFKAFQVENSTRVMKVSPATPIKRRCEECDKANTRCEHCFKCGSSDHFMRGCKKNLNITRSLKQGKQ